MDTLFQTFHAIFDHFPAWLNAILAVIGAASAITALTPTPRDDRLIGKLYRILEVLALNIGHAKDLPPNRHAPPSPKP